MIFFSNKFYVDARVEMCGSKYVGTQNFIDNSTPFSSNKDKSKIFKTLRGLAQSPHS